MTHDEIAEIAFHTIVTARAEGVADPLRLAHAVAVAMKLAESDAADLLRDVCMDWAPDCSSPDGECECSANRARRYLRAAGGDR